MNLVSNQLSRLKTLERTLRQATQDGRVTGAEGRAVDRAVKDVFDRANTLQPATVRPVMEAVAAVKDARGDKAVVTRADALVAEVRAARVDVRAAAAKDARTSAFKNLPGKGWKAPFDGVRTRDVRSGSLKIHMAVVDLANPNVRLQTNGEAGKGRTTSQTARGANAELAINGDFFTFATHRPSGLAKKDGRTWTGTQGKHRDEPYLAFSGQHAELKPAGARLPDWANNVVSARPLVLKNGRVVTSYSAGNHPEKAPRTAMGISKDGRKLFMVSVEGVDGRRSSGMTPDQVGRLLKSLGAYQGMCMDSGGSATMYVKGRGVVNRPTDGRERAVANTLLVQAA